MIFLGLDPGVSGALAAIEDHGCRPHPPTVYQIPLATRGKRQVVDGRGLVGLIRTIVGQAQGTGMREDVHATVEQLSPSPPAMGGSITSFQRGYSAAVADLALGGLGIEVHLVPPQTWQKVMIGSMTRRGVEDMPADDTKTRSIKAAILLFGKDLLLEGKMNSYDHNVADALLLCEYGRRLFTEQAKDVLRAVLKGRTG